MKLSKAQKLAEQAIYDYTSSSKWKEVKYMRWTTAEMQDVIAKALVKNNGVLGDVSNQRELMILTAQYCMSDTLSDKTANEIVDEVLKENQ